MELSAYLKSIDPSVGDPNEMYRFIERADRLRIVSKPYPDAPVLYESCSPEDLTDLAQSLTILRDATRAHSFSDGGPSIELFDGDEFVGRITNFSPWSVRYSGSDWNVFLEDCERWVDWFSRRGIDEPRTVLERHDTGYGNAARWLAEMEASKQPIEEEDGVFMPLGDS